MDSPRLRLQPKSGKQERNPREAMKRFQEADETRAWHHERRVVSLSFSVSLLQSSQEIMTLPMTVPKGLHLAQQYGPDGCRSLPLWLHR